MKKLASKVAVVTGASKGIGASVARHLAAEGASVVVTYALDKDGAARTVAAIEAAGGRAIAVGANLTREAEVARLFDETRRAFGRVDILVNNAGMSIRKPPHVLNLEEWETVMKTNLTSAFLCSQAAYPAMKAAGGGKVINIGSMLSIFGASFAPAYAASKGGIVQFTRSCAVAWAPDNIQVNAILPGWIDTELTQRARIDVAGLHDKVLARTPAARWGAPGDFAGIAAFLGSGASDFVTGTAIPVDGGYSIAG